MRTIALLLLGLGASACSSGPAEAPPESGSVQPEAAAHDGEQASPAARPGEVQEIRIDAATTFQTWEGAGASLMAWHPQARDQYRSERWQEIFADDVGMTVLRIDLLPTPLSPHGRHDYPTIELGPDLEANVAHFDYGRAERAAVFGEVARALKDRGVPLRVIASVWTPPHWMKEGARFANNGNDSGGGRLKMDAANLEQYARYMAAAVAAWEQRFGLPIDALSIQNEPRFEQEYSSMALRPPEYARALAAVDGELRRVGLGTRLFGPEDVGYGPEGDHSRLDQQLAFIRAVMEHPEASKAIDAFAVHGYGGDGIDSRGYVAPDNWRYYWSNIEAYGKPSWQTESGGGPPGGRGPVFFANVIFEGLTYGHVSLWCNWLLSQYGELDQHTLLGFDLNTDNAKYAVAKHYFRFIRPGDRRLGVQPADEHKVRVTAWQDPAGEHLSITLLNMDEAADASLRLQLGEAGEGRTLQRYQTSAEGFFVTRDPVRASDDGVLLVLPKQSLTTLSDVALR